MAKTAKELRMRYIGIQHRRKKTKAGEARPTRVCIIAEDNSITEYELEDEMSELNFVHDLYPVEFRQVEDSDDLANFKPSHIKWRRLKKDENIDEMFENRRRQEDKTWFVADKVASTFDGLRSGDVVGMVLGGSGDRFAYALSKRGEDIGASVFRLPSFVLKEKRGDEADKDTDANLLASLVRDEQSQFYLVNRRERDLIKLTQAYRDRMDAMKARIACEQKILQNLVGLIFCSEEGQYPEGTIEVLYEQAKVNDKILQGFVAEEKMRDKNLAKILSQLGIYEELFQKIEGVGPAIAARLIVAIRDVRRFATDAKLKAYLGVHVMNGGKFGDRPSDKQFVRRRTGEVANWQDDGRQALYLLADQFNRRPGSVWGKKLREVKVNLRAAHPDVMCKECECKWDDCQMQKTHKRKYTDGHIQKMALWRTASKFTVWLWREWMRVEQRQGKPVDVVSVQIVQQVETPSEQVVQLAQ